jgi:putative membrane-bound dehydrogenase-like protein
MTPARTRVLRIATVAAALQTLLVAPDARTRTTIAGQTLTVPDGFEIELVAGPPLVERPIVADFDDDGRLYVAESSGSNDKVEKQLADKPHRILRLEDADGDGRFDRRVVFADRMMLPEGALWFDGSLYVAAPPSIWRLTDTDDDGVADRREEWFEGKTLTGCANDLHGPYLGPDGWIYWTKGAFAQQTYERPGKPPLVTRAAHIFRRRPGSPIVESVMTGGMDNPVDVAFTPTGERILTTTFVEHPQLGRRDAVLHAVYGGVYGKPHGVIDGHPRTGDLMPVMSHLGPAAPSGLTSFASRAFGDDYRDNVFAALFNLHKVTRHALEPSGSTFKSRDSDFVVSDSLDFHPTDVVDAGDGSLLVIDTGAWYKLCCPSSQLAKPDVPGAIYRVRRRGVAPPGDPRGRTLPWRTLRVDQLSALLDDPRPAVVARAVHRLGQHGPDAVTTLETTVRRAASVDARRQAVWALTRIDAARAREVVRLALGDRDAGVRQTAIYSAGLWRDSGAAPLLRASLGPRGSSASSPTLRRATAEALGRIGDAAAVPDLLALATPRADRTLEHALIYALIEVGDATSTAAGLRSASPHVRRAALIALDQIDGGRLQPDTVTALLDSPDRLLNETAWWIAARHPDWGSSLVRYFEPRLTARGRAEERQSGRTGEREKSGASASTSAAGQQGSGAGGQAEANGGGIEQKLAQFGDSPAIQALLAATAAHTSPDVRLAALRTMAQVRVKELPAVWIAPLVAALSADALDVARVAVSVARVAPAPKDRAPELRTALVRVARDDARPAEVRLDALASAAASDGALTSVEPDLFELLRASLDPSRPTGVRVAAATIVEKAPLDRAQLQALIGLLDTAGPLELPRLLPAFDRGSDEPLGLAMLAALDRAKARASVRPDVLRPRLLKYPAPVQQRGEALLERLDLDAAQQRRRLEELLTVMRDGDLRRGQVLFNSTKAACSTCHAIGYQGGRIGPDLTSIGQIRSERDLLEAIVFPSASFARGYESVVVTTTSGAVHSGVLRRELPDEVVVATSEQDETRIPRARIEDMQPGLVSVMPSGFGDLLSRQELADLLAFLKQTRWGAN